VAFTGGIALYAAAEEGEAHFRERCRRCFEGPHPSRELLFANVADFTRLLFLESATLGEILDEAEGVSFLVVDSLQAVVHPSLDATPGGPVQAKTCAAALIGWARRTRGTVWILNRETKDGEAAGPADVGHMVDVRLALNAAGGDHPAEDRQLLTEKNRFGPAPWQEFLRMTDRGLV
jgi:DNA repair protein RadA/Sms